MPDRDEEGGISEHWLIRGIQSAFFYYVSCGPCIVVETKWRRQTQARRERRMRQKVRREKMEYRKRKKREAGTETGDDADDEDGDGVIEMEVTDPNGASRIIGVGLSGQTDEHMFLPFEVNEYWGDEIAPSSEAPWWWKRLTGQDPNAAEPNVPTHPRALGRKRFFRPSSDNSLEEQEKAPKEVDRDDGDMWPLNESHPPVLCRGEIAKEDIGWIKEPPPSTSVMRRMQGTVYEVDLDKLSQIPSWQGPITSHPAVSKIEYANQYMTRRSSSRSTKATSSTASPKTKISDPETTVVDSDKATTKLSPSSSHIAEGLLTPPITKADGVLTPTARPDPRPDSAVSASRLKNRSQAPVRRIRSGSHTETTSSEDADDEDENEDEISPKTLPLSKPKPVYHGTATGKGKLTTKHAENISPRVSPQTIGSALSSSDSLAGVNWLPPRMLGAKTNSSANVASGSGKAQ